MSDLTRYFQLTPDILVEYNYFNLDNAQEQEGDVSDHIIDFDDNAYIVYNSYCATRTFFWDQNNYPYKVDDKEYYYKNLKDNFVLPINQAESKFVQCVNSNNAIWSGGDYNIKISESPIFNTVNNSDNGDLLCDNFRLHFTSRNYLGNNDYDGFIISVHIYDNLKNKICLLSKYIRKTDDSNINENPVIINQKLYTTHLDFIIPNISAILNSNLEWVRESLNNSEDTLKNALSPKYGIMDNTPVVMNIYGVKSTVVKNNYEQYVVEKLNSIYIPIIDKSSNLSINIEQASDGDYFDIYPEFKNNRISFSDYVYNLSKDETGKGRPEIYIVFHELTLTEHYTDNLNNVHNDITHREQFIINASNRISGDGDVETSINESELDRHIYYRPVLRNTGKNLSFTIDVKTNIINTLDNTTIVLNATADFGSDSAKKYGKRMNKIYLGEVPAQINVYNKKPDIDIDSVKITNASSNVKIENHQHSVIGFIECANVGVSIEQLPKELIS